MQLKTFYLSTIILLIAINSYAQEFDSTIVNDYLLNFSKAVNIKKSEANFKSTVLYVEGQSLEPYYFASFDSIRALYRVLYETDLNVSLQCIIREFNPNVVDNYVDGIVKYFHDHNLLLDITIPNFNYYLKTEGSGINFDPLIAYNNGGESQKFKCINCITEYLDIMDTKENMGWIITYRINPNIIINEPFYRWILNCTASKNPLVSCDYCPSSNPISGSLPQIAGNTNNWELAIRNRNTNSSHMPYGNGGNDACLSIRQNPAINQPTQPGSYALLYPRSDIADMFKIVRYDCNSPTNFYSYKAVKVNDPLVDLRNRELFQIMKLNMEML